jgi:hypothetical protein
MKSILQFACCGLLLMLGCRDAENNNATSTQTSTNKLNASVGQEIPLETAQRWIASYDKEKNSGREGGSYSLTASKVNLMLQALPDRIGVILHHATDDAGNYHILVTAVEAGTSLWDSPVVVDANTNTVIEKATAKAWAKKYRDTHLGETWYHFFGNTVLNQITTMPNFNYMDIVPALNDVNDPQLLLFAWNNSSEGGRVANGLVATVYDFSTNCPPYCDTFSYE